MKFKIDENLPAEYAVALREAGFEADTVADDFANLQAYPCHLHAGIVILRPRTQDKAALMAFLRRLIPVFRERVPKRRLWTVEVDRIRFREQ